LIGKKLLEIAKTLHNAELHQLESYLKNRSQHLDSEIAKVRIRLKNSIAPDETLSSTSNLLVKGDSLQVWLDPSKVSAVASSTSPKVDGFNNDLQIFFDRIKAS